MTSRFTRTPLAIASAVVLLAGCSEISDMFGGKSSQSSGSSGASSSASTGTSTGTTGVYGSASTSGTSSGMSSGSTTMVSVDQVKQAQQALKDQGLYKGRIDGIIGPQTRRALSQYQRDHQLTQTATLDSETLQSLNGPMSSGGSK